MKTRKITLVGVCVSLAMVLSYLESLLPLAPGIPGIKLGLANIVVVYALYSIDRVSALLISAVRVCLSALLFGSVMSLAYAAAGALCSYAVMLALCRLPHFSPVGVSIAGGVVHNIAQIGVAIAVFGQPAIASYLPYLILSGTLAGIAVGVSGGVLIKKVRFKS